MRYIVLILLLLAFFSFGYCAQMDEAFVHLKSELKEAGVTENFIKTTEPQVKKMINAGANIADIKPVLLDLWKEGVKGMALKNAVSAVAELVSSGDTVKEASIIASGAAHKAEAEGLGGFAVGMRVKKAVQERKEYLKSKNITT